MAKKVIQLTKPDDWHLHIRDGEMMFAVLRHILWAARAIIMPNLVPPITTTDLALAYMQRIMAALPPGAQFTPLMTLYLTNDTTPDEIYKAWAAGIRFAKLYPAGATTNSASGVTDIRRINAALNAMQEVGMALLVHGEVTDPSVDIFDREAVFIERILKRLVQQFPHLRIVLEHVTTKEAVQFVMNARDGIGATITAHHLMFNRNHMLVGGIKPHYYCLPILKAEENRKALVKAATGGSKRFFLGTDSAPHPQNAKECACGCAGSYTAPTALAMFAQVFEQADALDKLEAFAAFHGADFYGLPRNEEQIWLVPEDWQVPESYPVGDGSQVVPLMAGQTLGWKFHATEPQEGRKLKAA